MCHKQNKFFLTIGISLLITLLFTACKCYKKENTKTTTIVTTNEYTNMIVSFYSPGNGIDYKTANEFEDFLKSYVPKVNYDIIHWGREGETDYCIDLLGLDKKEQESFKEKAKTTALKSDRVNISENEKCREISATD